MTLSTKDKKRLVEAFRDVVNKNPSADQSLEGDYAGITLRQYAELIIAEEQFYTGIEKVMAKDKMTLDQYIKVLEKTFSAFPKLG